MEYRDERFNKEQIKSPFDNDIKSELTNVVKQNL